MQIYISLTNKLYSDKNKDIYLMDKELKSYSILKTWEDGCWLPTDAQGYEMLHWLKDLV